MKHLFLAWLFLGSLAVGQSPEPAAKPAQKPDSSWAVCSSAAVETLSNLDPEDIRAEIEDIKDLSGEEIKVLQVCLRNRGCYQNDPSKIDGRVGIYTTAAIIRSANGQCGAAPVRQKEDCGEGDEMFSYQLTGGLASGFPFAAELPLHLLSISVRLYPMPLTKSMTASFSAVATFTRVFTLTSNSPRSISPMWERCNPHSSANPS